MAQGGMEAVLEPGIEQVASEPVLNWPEQEPSPYRLTIPLLLAAGWGALLAFSVMFLIEDGRDSNLFALAKRGAGEGAGETATIEPAAHSRPRWQTADASEAAPATIRTVSASADALPVAAPAIVATPAPRPAQLGYVGTWGPSAYACLAQSKRRGYIPATISENGAKAGHTLCRFRNGRREGAGWTMSADCSERGRNWSAQVRLLVDGDRLTWTSANGSSNYVRCGRRG